MLTAHDYPSGLLCDRAGVDAVLVGDSLSMVVLGHADTCSVTMDEMLHHCRAVQRGVRRAFLIGDMPFGSYQASRDGAVQNAVRFVKEGRVQAVKLEGGIGAAATVRAIVQAGIPVLGHIGLTPQSAMALGGYRVQGRSADGALRLLDDALALQDAGCFGIVIEAVPDPVARRITQRLAIPTIGIGAGPGCSGQVLVLYDTLGIYDRPMPRFCKQYAHLAPVIESAIAEYCKEVGDGSFPAAEHCYAMPDDQVASLDAALRLRSQQAVAATPPVPPRDPCPSARGLCTQSAPRTAVDGQV